MVWILYKCHFESFKLTILIVLIAFFKVIKKNVEIIQLVSKTFYKKNIYPSMQIHIHYANLSK
jgi:hypothetical protein